MRIIAYLYSDPLLESPPDPTIWGWEVDQIYQDLGGRQQLHQLILDCQAESENYLLIRRLEELGDSLEEVSDRLRQIEALGIILITTEQAYTSVSKDTKHQANLLKLLGDVERETSRRRLRQGHARNRIKALPPPGKAPYGYRRGKDRYILDRSTAPVVKDFFEQFLLYGSLRGAVRYLEKKYNKKISVATGQRWLTNPVYRGNLAYQNGEVISDTHSPILNREEAAQIDRLLRRNRRMPSRTASAPRSLAGLVVCGECHSRMSITSVTRPRQGRDYLYLRPINCPQRPKCRAFPYEQVLDRTIQSICRELPRAVADMNVPNLNGVKRSLTNQIAKQQAILDQIKALIATGVLDTETANLRTYKLRTELSQLQSQLAALPPVNLKAIAQTVSIPQFWTDLSESERRFYFREFIRQIEIVRQDKAWQLRLIFIF
ncbi:MULTISPECIES: recombinase family protein [unclassified Coleofasciculus]|uniref:recombinase family protein n=1 Tax=unclassified Coleofasciculus TaxID=2692782 RepID=UPI001881E804|nr:MULTISPECIES: recombinase family protein [unclassified Coleofasciculus]MBE9125129.1 recombinase family protein [Coleofasciculus sp. LEGE 07081]MBE9148346.1 recombinase family protein [Coleofasciculus sp. LEGE 07092]